MPITVRFPGALPLLYSSGQSATRPSSRPPAFRYCAKYTGEPIGVTAAAVSHATSYVPMAQQQLLPDLPLRHLREIIRPARLRSWYVLSFGHEEHIEALRALHQIGEDQTNSRITRNCLACSTFNKNSSAAKRLNCSL